MGAQQSSVNNHRYLTKRRQNLVFFMKQTFEEFDISLKGGRMYLNRFCIDEDAAFELSAVFINYGYRQVEELIDSAFQRIVENKTEDMETHFIFAGGFFEAFGINDLHNPDELQSLIEKSMNKYGMKSIMVSIIYMERVNLITKEKMKIYCKGKEEWAMSSLKNRSMMTLNHLLKIFNLVGKMTF